MSDRDAVDLALLLFRCGVGAVMLAHGINHISAVAGFLAWRWLVRVDGHAAPLAAGVARQHHRGRSGRRRWCSACSPRSVVRAWSARWPWRGSSTTVANGFFIFRPGEGWEYVMTLVRRRPARSARSAPVAGRSTGARSRRRPRRLAGAGALAGCRRGRRTGFARCVLATAVELSLDLRFRETRPSASIAGCRPDRRRHRPRRRASCRSPRTE